MQFTRDPGSLDQLEKYVVSAGKSAGLCTGLHRQLVIGRRVCDQGVDFQVLRRTYYYALKVMTRIWCAERNAITTDRSILAVRSWQLVLRSRNKRSSRIRGRHLPKSFESIKIQLLASGDIIGIQDSHLKPAKPQHQLIVRTHQMRDAAGRT